MIVDAHAHIFPRINGQIADGPTRSAGFGRATVGDEVVQIFPPFNEQTEHAPLSLIAHMDWAGVDQTVLLQGPFYGVCNEFVNEALGQYGDRLCGAAHFDPWSGDGPDEFDALLNGSNFCALKIEFSVPAGLSGLHHGARLDDPDIAWMFDEIDRRGLVFTVDLGAVGDPSYQTDAVRSIAESHPAMPIVIPHLAQPTPIVQAEEAMMDMWRQQIDLAKLPNVWIDNSALPHKFEAEGIPFPGARQAMREAIDRVGPDKIMWGTDVPGLFGLLTYRQLVEVGRQWISHLSDTDQQRIMGENALHVYRHHGGLAQHSNQQ